MEIWKSVVGFEGVYSVSDCGRVRSEYRVSIRSNGWPCTTEQKILSTCSDSKGYPQIRLYVPAGNKKSAKQKLVHRLVAEAFIRPLEKGEQVDHINGIRNDTRLENLQIVSGSMEHWHTSTWPRIAMDKVLLPAINANIITKELAERIIAAAFKE
jgi:hypothetical protein